MKTHSGDSPRALLFYLLASVFLSAILSSLSGERWLGSFLLWLLIFSILLLLASGMGLAVFSDKGAGFPKMSGGYIQNGYLISQQFSRSLSEYVDERGKEDVRLPPVVSDLFIAGFLLFLLAIIGFLVV